VAHILLIDDDDHWSQLVREELEALGHAVDWLEQAREGPDLLTRNRYDLVLLDNVMPGMTGIEFLEALRGSGIEVPVVLMTGYSTSDTAIQATRLGAVDYVIKPDDAQGLSRELRSVIPKALELTQPAGGVEVRARAAPTAAGLVLVGKSRPMVDVFRQIGQFADSSDPVLIRGETGTGKELVARAFHTNSRRKTKPFVALNCTAINENLLESELFGHEPGAFTGADKLRKGKIEYANGGTLFLDEIGDMPLHLQAKLLRVIEYQEVERVGSNEPIKVNVRLLSATHRDLEAAIAEGKFRRDLFHRLNRVTLRLPPLRERPDDLPELVGFFLTRAAEAANRPRLAVSAAALDLLRAYLWPGNIRELQNVVFRAFGVCRGPLVLPEHLDFAAGPADCPAGGDEAAARAGLRTAVDWAWDLGGAVWDRLHDLLEYELLQTALARLGGNQTEVADKLGLARGTVIKRMQKYGLK
jgi:DNA-binding NtrC family response regulator